jgi:hypothetical protein
MQDFSKLSQWIQPQHLAADNFDRLRNCSTTEFLKGVVIDNFFRNEIIERVQVVVAREALFSCHYKLFSNPKPVSVEAFRSASEEDQFLFRSHIDGVKPEYRMSKNWVTYLKFRNFYETELPEFLEGISGLRLAHEASFTHSHSYCHSLKKHNDYLAHRRLCTVLYLSPGWNSNDGGNLHMSMLENGEEMVIEALCNRIVIFTPSLKTEHYVSRHSDIAKEKNRDCHVAWYKHRE